MGASRPSSWEQHEPYARQLDMQAPRVPLSMASGYVGEGRSQEGYRARAEPAPRASARTYGARVLWCAADRSAPLRASAARHGFRAPIFTQPAFALHVDPATAPHGPLSPQALKSLNALSWCKKRFAASPQNPLCNTSMPACCISDYWLGQNSSGCSHSDAYGFSVSESSHASCSKQLGAALAFSDMLGAVHRRHGPGGNLSPGYVLLVEDDTTVHPQWATHYEQFFQEFGCRRPAFDVAKVTGNGGLVHQHGAQATTLRDDLFALQRGAPPSSEIAGSGAKYFWGNAGILIHSSQAAAILYQMWPEHRAGGLDYSLISAFSAGRLEVVVSRHPIISVRNASTTLG